MKINKNLLNSIKEIINEADKSLNKFDEGNFQEEILNSSLDLYGKAIRKLKKIPNAPQKSSQLYEVNQKLEEINDRLKFLKFYDSYIHLHLI